MVKDYFNPMVLNWRVEIEKLGENFIHQILNNYDQLQHQFNALNDLLEGSGREGINIQDSILMWEGYLPTLQQIKKIDLNLLHEKAILEEDVDGDTIVEWIRAIKMVIKEYTKVRDKIIEQINSIYFVLSHME